VAITVGAVVTWIVPIVTDAAGARPAWSVFIGITCGIFSMFITAWIYGARPSRQRHRSGRM
jgi:hypothetical protein